MKLPIGYVPGVGVKKSTGYGGFGQKMLEKMGWQKGDGLGRSRQGMTEAIEVKQKEDTAGVGANAGWDWGLKHWEEAYNQAVQAVQAHEDDSSSSSDSDESSDADEPALDTLMHRDGTTAVVSKQELALANALAKDPWGRFGGREGKMARIRRQEQILAEQARSKLGVQKSAARASAKSGSAALDSNSEPEPESESAQEQQGEEKKLKKKKSKKRKNEQEEDEEEARVEEGEKCVKKKKKKKTPLSESEPETQPVSTAREGEREQPRAKNKTPRVADVQQIVLQHDAPSDSTQTTTIPVSRLPPYWWGHKYFVSAGTLAGIEDEVKKGKAQRQTFDEDDQTKLYMSTFDKQSKGKKGLGQSKIKIAGGNWEGTKVRFADEDGDNVESAGKGGGADGVTGCSKAGREESVPEAAGVSCPSQQGSSSSVAWVKIAKKCLKTAPDHQLKTKALWKEAKKQLQSLDSSWVETAECKESFMAKVCKSSKFVVEGKLVTLSSK